MKQGSISSPTTCVGDESRCEYKHEDEDEGSSLQMPTKLLGELQTLASSSLIAIESSEGKRGGAITNRPSTGSSLMNMMGISLAVITLALAGSFNSQPSHFLVSGFSPPICSPASCSRLPLKGSQQPNYLSTGPLWGAVNSDTDIIKTTTQKSSKKAKSTSAKKYKKKFSKKKGGKGKGNHPYFNAARQFNSELTKCNTVSELLTTFTGQASAKSSDVNGNANPSSAATHLAGAFKVNSVNFSTCLHRLARFASYKNYNYSNQKDKDEVDERKKVLADPRFALLVCSMAEMASGCDATVSIKEGNMVVEQWKRDTGSISMNDMDGGVKEADDVLNAIAGIQSSSESSSDSSSSTEERAAIATQAMSQISTPNTKNAFSSRECSNVCWALAKLRMAPPSSAFSVGRVVADVATETSQGGNNVQQQQQDRQFVSMDEMALDTLQSSLQVRMSLFEEALNRKKSGGGASSGLWIPELSKLAGKVLDLIAVKIIEEYNGRSSTSDSGGEGTGAVINGSAFNPQEMASVLWAFAKAKRADDLLFNTVARELVRTAKFELERGGNGPKPQGEALCFGIHLFASFRFCRPPVVLTVCVDTPTLSCFVFRIE